MEEKIWHRHYDAGVPRELDFEAKTMPRMLEEAAQRWPSSPALIFLNCRMDYRRFKEEVDRLATALSRLGVGPDSRVAVLLPNLPQTPISVLAVLATGAQVVMTNPLYTPREIEHQWNDAGCSVAIVGDWLYAATVQGMRDRLPVRDYIIARIPEYLRFPLNLLAPLKLKKETPPLYAEVEAGPGIHFFRKLVRATPPNPPRPKISMDDLALLQYTGGTTGVSKGAMLTHRNVSYNVQQVRAWFPDLEYGKEVVLGALPFFHVFGMNISLMLPVSCGLAMALMPNPRDIDTMVKIISKHRVTLMPAVPRLFQAINQYPGIERLDMRSIKYCFSGSAPLGVETLETFERLTGAKIVEGFGLTETSPVTHVNPLSGKRKAGSVGIPVSSTDARIVDPELGETEMPLGKEGELILRGPQIMKGYWNRPDETAKVIRNGWLYTGDLARMDEDGYFWIVGRKKDMILASGYNIYPDEIDQVLLSHPKVLEACTIGVPDPERGETVKSFVVLKEGEKATAEEILAFCREHLAAYKIPRSLEFRDELPKSAMMKLLRRVLKDEEMAKRKG